MAQLDKIWINKIDVFDQVKCELRVDWSNDRHQAIHLDGLKVKDLIKGLQKAIIILEDEERAGNLDD